MEVPGIISAVITMFAAYKLVFSDYHELLEAIRFWITPDSFSFYTGRGIEDFYAELKLSIVMIVGVLTYIGISGLGS